MQSRKEIVVEELHKPVRRNYPRRKFEMRGIDETWQADLVNKQLYARENKGFKHAVTIIDVFSKFALSVASKSKTGDAITEAMNSGLVKGRAPKNLQVDQGSECYNSKFKPLSKKNNIHLYSTYSYLKASIIERCNRTLKTNMWQKISLQGDYK